MPTMSLDWEQNMGRVMIASVHAFDRVPKAVPVLCVRPEQAPATVSPLPLSLDHAGRLMVHALGSSIRYRGDLQRRAVGRRTRQSAKRRCLEIASAKGGNRN